MIKYGDVQTATIDIDRATEFVGDDVDQYSSLVDLGGQFNTIVIQPSTLTSTAINVYVQDVAAIDTVPVIVHQGQVTGATPAWGTAAWTTTAGTGNMTITCPIGCYRYVRIRCTSDQTTSDKTIYVRGINL